MEEGGGGSTVDEGMVEGEGGHHLITGDDGPVSSTPGT
jgi:hypothetical protein